MRRMHGFTMVELMVAMGLGILISAAAIQLFLANQVAFNFQRGMNDVQANGRFVIDQIVHDVRLAGLGKGASATGGALVVLPAIIFSSADLPALPAGNRPVTANDQGTPGPASTDGAGVLAKSDQIVVQHLALTDTVDCEGNSVTAGNYVVSRYFVGPDAANNNIPALMCDGASSDGTTLTGYDTATALLDGVDSFQILYGIDDGQNGSAQVAQYISATAYNALATKPVILSVRIALYMQSQERAGDVRPPSSDLQVLDTTIAQGSVPDDALMRRLFVTTINLRNASATGV